MKSSAVEGLDKNIKSGKGLKNTEKEKKGSEIDVGQSDGCMVYWF